MEAEGGVEMPQEVNLLKMIQSREQEIKTMYNDLKGKRVGTRAIQRLPRHQRRRAASHNPRRVPHAVKHLMVTSSNKKEEKVSKSKEKKRIQMKKHQHHLKVDARNKTRNERPDRMVLHMWFSKRFKMVDMMGIKVPSFNNNKNRRMLFRKSRKSVAFFYLSPEEVAISFSKALADNHFNSSLDTQTTITFSLNTITRHDLYDGIQGHFFGRIEAMMLTTEFNQKDTPFIFCHRSIVDNVMSYFEELTPFIYPMERIRLVGPNGHLMIDNLRRDIDQTIKFTAITTKDVGSISPRAVIDVFAERDVTKRVWSQLVKNKSHLVGGIRDHKMMHFNCEASRFPHFGYVDIVGGSNDLQNLKCHLRSLIPSQSDDLKVDRSLGQSEVISLKNIKGDHFYPILAVAEGRGCPSMNDPMSMDEDGKELIGFIECGDYCLDRGFGKGIGYILGSKLVKVIERSMDNPFCFLRCGPSSVTRKVTISIMSVA